jgi:DNA-binding HxlR family transcriptional regulator
MKRTSFARWPCSVARAVDILGDWWTPLVLRECFYGVRRFEDFQRVLQIGRNVLTQRLGRLVDEGILERVRYSERPPRHEYLLTAKGRDLWPVLAAIGAWGDAHLAGEAGPPLTMRHTVCGHDTTPTVVCSHCGDPLDHREVRTRFGTGFPGHLRERARALGRFDDADPAAP